MAFLRLINKHEEGYLMRRYRFASIRVGVMVSFRAHIPALLYCFKNHTLQARKRPLTKPRPRHLKAKKAKLAKLKGTDIGNSFETLDS